MDNASQLLFIITIVLALSYAFSNGLNDAANALATVVGTRVLSPLNALILGASMNLLGAVSGTAVAKTIGKGIVDPNYMTQAAVIAAILAAVVWVVFATRFGFPVSVSHSLVAGVTGAGVATAGLSRINDTVVIKVILALGFSPILGFTSAFVLMLIFPYHMVSINPKEQKHCLQSQKIVKLCDLSVLLVSMQPLQTSHVP